ncbi:hypothetical protein Agub_g7166, partial [Astrephomene gubernaculifera]
KGRGRRGGGGKRGAAASDGAAGGTAAAGGGVGGGDAAGVCEHMRGKRRGRGKQRCEICEANLAPRADPEQVGPQDQQQPSPSSTYCGATLVVCPLVALIQWRGEIARFTAPGALKVVVYHGGRRGQVAGGSEGAALREADVVLTTYSVVESEYRRCMLPDKVQCSYCGKRFYPERLKVHLRFFCGPNAVKSEALARQQRKDKKTKKQSPGGGGGSGGGGSGGGKNGNGKRPRLTGLRSMFAPVPTAEDEDDEEACGGGGGGGTQAVGSGSGAGPSSAAAAAAAAAPSKRRKTGGGGGATAAAAADGGGSEDEDEGGEGSDDDGGDRGLMSAEAAAWSKAARAASAAAAAKRK